MPTGPVQCPHCQNVFVPPAPSGSTLVLNESIRIYTCPKCLKDFKVRSS